MAGQSDYVAANTFLDAFAEERTRRGHRTITVDWSDWIGTGMAGDHDVARDLGFFRSLTAEEATTCFDAVLASAPARLIVGAINYPRLASGSRDLAELLLRAPLRLAGPLRTAVENATRTGPPVPPPELPVPQLALSGREDGAYTDMERTLAQIWARELGVGELDFRESSFDLGMDSLMALALAQQVEAATGLEVSMVDLFRYVTVADLARQLDGRTSR